MKTRFESTRIGDIFDVRSGDIHALTEVDSGNVPLISCGEINNGFVGYYDIPKEMRYSRAITVAYNGSWPLTSKFHPYEFGTKDDVAVLIPLEPLSDATMLYAAAMLNRLIWRYSYGRKCFKAKLRDVAIFMPVTAKGEINERYTASLLDRAVGDVQNAAKRSADRVLSGLNGQS